MLSKRRLRYLNKRKDSYMQKITLEKSINTTICDLLPEEISDECAYHLVNFFMNLASELESYYFAQMRRHVDNMKNN